MRHSRVCEKMCAVIFKLEPDLTLAFWLFVG